MQVGYISPKKLIEWKHENKTYGLPRPGARNTCLSKNNNINVIQLFGRVLHTEKYLTLTFSSKRHSWNWVVSIRRITKYQSLSCWKMEDLPTLVLFCQASSDPDIRLPRWIPYPTYSGYHTHSLNTVPYHTVPPLNIVPHHTLNTTWPISHRALLHTNCLLCILAFSLYIWPIL